jgi:hypothetical protein
MEISLNNEKRNGDVASYWVRRNETGTWLVIGVRDNLGLWQGTRIRSCESMPIAIYSGCHLLIAERPIWLH